MTVIEGVHISVLECPRCGGSLTRRRLDIDLTPDPLSDDIKPHDVRTAPRWSIKCALGHRWAVEKLTRTHIGDYLVLGETLIRGTTAPTRTLTR